MNAYSFFKNCSTKSMVCHGNYNDSQRLLRTYTHGGHANKGRAQLHCVQRWHGIEIYEQRCLYTLAMDEGWDECRKQVVKNAMRSSLHSCEYACIAQLRTCAASRKNVLATFYVWDTFSLA